MGSVHAKPRMMKKQYSSRSHGNRQSSSLMVSVIRGLMLAVAAAAVLFLIIYSLPSLNLFLFEVIPSFWRGSCALFTPKNLFVLLNLIILSILAMAHLHSTQSSSASSSMLQRPACSQDTTEYGAVERSISESFKLVDKKSADFQLVSEVESTNEQINDTDHDDDDDRDNHAMNTGLMAIKEMIIETHLQQAVDNAQQCADHHETGKRKAEPESKKARSRCGGEAAESKKVEKATATLQGNPLNKFYNIDSLLSEEGSIFTRSLEQSRPLPSARKKAPKLSGLERPLSPFRPILKRGDTLDATWKAICESKRHSSPLNRHHSKHPRKVDPSQEIIDNPRAPSSSPLSPIKQRSKIFGNSLHNKDNPLNNRREPSMPQEELNAKVESFISRFNEQIRIQREKSLLDYMEMVGRGSS